MAKGASELCSLAFYTTVGYKFRPHPENPYLRVHSEEDEVEAAAPGGAEGRSISMSHVMSAGGQAHTHSVDGPDRA